MFPLHQRWTLYVVSTRRHMGDCSMIAALALAFQRVPPPLYVTTGPMRPSAGAEVRPEPMRVDVTLRGPGATLWQGQLALGQGGASWRESVSEAGGCTTPYGEGTVQREASIQLIRQRNGAADPGASVQVSVRWVCPAEARGGCGATRTVELRQSVDLSTGPARLTGDGGLVVELRRR
ncbi:hypothetical protein GGQ80_001930 [Sphingomonas jinjuensis]|uniref:Uncharacterized protein n=1 Tax=Sphingomonas jinjuensis TaxID=535907 RepID=A0A840F7T6_9SPHN|nr:hypothetical protein [Sphingomonas jinjuensis]MBB4154020.1 hypothetical protein [Sphingomonas jinjuensis]